VARPEPAIAALARHLEVEPAGFDRAVFAHRPRGWTREPVLTREDRRALRDPRLWDVAHGLGYAPHARASPFAALRRRLRGARVAAVRDC
jgi:hypothetical protein